MPCDLPTNWRRTALAGLLLLPMTFAAASQRHATRIDDQTPSTPAVPPQGGALSPGSTHPGVIVPPHVGDTAIKKEPPPASKFPTPVLPAPVSPQGDQQVQPK